MGKDDGLYQAGPGAAEIKTHLKYVERPGRYHDALMEGSHEAQLLGAFLEEWEICKEYGGIFVDVGAHVGHWSIRAAVDGLMVVAVEPHGDTAEALRSNVASNGVAHRVRIAQVAAWSEPAMVFMDTPTHDEAVGLPPVLFGAEPHSYSGGVTVVNRETKLQVEAQPLDEIVQESPVGFVKIDVEGAEAHVLRGMNRILRDEHPRILVEMHDRYYGAHIADQVKTTLAGAGYQWAKLGDLGSHWYLLAWTR
jgi:FkbM family methyltransferase